MTFRRLALLCLVLSASCTSARHYELTGQILSVNRDKQEVLVKHDEIPGYMIPMPTYCPMMDRNFAAVQKQIKANPALRDNVRLLSVSFDPKNDTPTVLKKHAKELGADPVIWTFVTADQDAVDRFAMSFGLTLIRGGAPNP